MHFDTAIDVLAVNMSPFSLTMQFTSSCSLLFCSCSCCRSSSSLLALSSSILLSASCSALMAASTSADGPTSTSSSVSTTQTALDGFSSRTWSTIPTASTQKTKHRRAADSQSFSHCCLTMTPQLWSAALALVTRVWRGEKSLRHPHPDPR